MLTYLNQKIFSVTKNKTMEIHRILLFGLIIQLQTTDSATSKNYFSLGIQKESSMGQRSMLCNESIETAQIYSLSVLFKTEQHVVPCICKINISSIAQSDIIVQNKSSTLFTLTKDWYSNVSHILITITKERNNRKVVDINIQRGDKLEESHNYFLSKDGEGSIHNERIKFTLASRKQFAVEYGTNTTSTQSTSNAPMRPMTNTPMKPMTNAPMEQETTLKPNSFTTEIYIKNNVTTQESITPNKLSSHVLWVIIGVIIFTIAIIILIIIVFCYKRKTHNKSNDTRPKVTYSNITSNDSVAISPNDHAVIKEGNNNAEINTDVTQEGGTTYADIDPTSLAKPVTNEENDDGGDSQQLTYADLSMHVKTYQNVN